jgi:hypothetical protein
MKRFISIQAVSALMVLAFAIASNAASLSPSGYRQQLDQFNKEIVSIRQHPELAQQLQSEVPDSVSIHGKSGDWSVSYSWLKQNLQQFQRAQPEKRQAFLDQIAEQLQARRSEAEVYDRDQPQLKPAQKKLDEVLSRREFRNVRGPGLLDIWLEKILRWIDKLLSPAGRSGAAPDILHILVYVLVAIALSWFAIWLKRRLDVPRDRESPREIVPFSPSARGWRRWLADARRSAEQQDWRNGVHLAYWAGIAFLEERGAWRPDRARTPREYLRLLGTRQTEHSTLTALTRQFEMIWYGNREASDSDFREALGQLEKLGCR